MKTQKLLTKKFALSPKTAVFFALGAFLAVPAHAQDSDNAIIRLVQRELFQNVPVQEEEKKQPALDELFRGNSNAKSAYENETCPLIDRVSAELRARFPEFDPENAPVHRRFLELFVHRNLTQEKISGRPASMREIEDAFNRAAATPRDSGTSPLYDWFAANPLGPWTNIVAELQRYGSKEYRRQVFDEKLKAWEKFLDVCADDPFAAAFFTRTAPTTLYETVPEEKIRDPWLREFVTGTRLMDEAWEARGKGYADEVTEEGWKVFRQKLAEAKERFVKADAMRPERPNAKAQLTALAFLLHDADPLKQARAALDAEKDSTVVFTLQNFFLPRWGGNIGLEYALAKATIENATDDSVSAFHGLQIWISVLQREADYVRLLQNTPRELFDAFKAKYERLTPQGKYGAWYYVPEVYAAQTALIFRDYEFAEKLYRENEEKFRGYAAYLRGMFEPISQIPWIDAENYLREFSVGERRNELREAWSALGSGNEKQAKTLFAKIVRDETAPVPARKVALDIYFRAWGNLIPQSRAFRCSFAETPFANYLFLSSNKRPTQAFFEVLDMAKTVPGELAETMRVNSKSKYGLANALNTVRFFSDPQRLRVIKIASETPDGQKAVNNYYWNRMTNAIARRDAATVRAILAEGASPDVSVTDGRPPSLFHDSLLHSSPEITRILLEAGARGWDTPEERKCCSSVAIYPKEGFQEILNMMLDRGYPIDGKDQNGKTLLDYAAEFSNGEIVRVLLERGADADALSPAGKRAVKNRAELRKIFEEFKKKRDNEKNGT